MLKLRPDKPFRPAVAAAVVALIVVAEALALTHALDRDAHATDEPCKICLSVASLGGGAVAHDTPFLLEREAHAPAVYDAPFARSPRPDIRSARGPPAAS